MGRLLGIATREKTRVPMDEHESISVSIEAGLDGDFRGRMKGRNVTVITREGWEKTCEALGDELPWTTRRANLLVEGVDVVGRTGARLRIGELVLQIQGECEPCHVMDKQRDGLRKALEPDWRAGLECTVLEPAHIRVGDAVTLEPGS